MFLLSGRPKPLGGKVTCMLTLWEMKRTVENPGERKNVPTAKRLQDAEMVVASRRMGMDAEIKVYQCGYVVYRLGKYVTVFPVHACGDYLYLLCGEICCIGEAFFDRQEWYVRLVLEGEDRVSRNRESQEQGKCISYSAISEDWSLLMDVRQFMLEQIIVKESVREMLELLTEKQRTVIIQFFFRQKTQKEIGEELGNVSQQAVSLILTNALRRMRRYLDTVQSPSFCKEQKGGNTP